MRNPFRIALLCIVCLLLAHCENGAPPSELSGPYMGQAPPGSTPVMFAPGVVSTNEDELNATFSVDGKELYFSRRLAGRVTLMVAREDDGKWTDATVAPFSGEYADVDPFLTSEGSRLYFSSRRPIDASGQSKDADIWFVERQPEGLWSEPRRIAQLNVTGLNDYYTSVSADGTLYFSRFSLDGIGDLYSSAFENGSFGEPEYIAEPVNTDLDEHDPFIAADGSFLIFSSSREGGYGQNDLYISFLDGAGNWLEPISMGEEINSAGYDYCPNVSHDGKYLFFTREINGNGDIFWMDAGVIDGFRSN